MSFFTAFWDTLFGRSLVLGCDNAWITSSIASLKTPRALLAFNEYFIVMSLLCSAYIPALPQPSTISRESRLASHTIEPSLPDPLILASGK